MSPDCSRHSSHHQAGKGATFALVTALALIGLPHTGKGWRDHAEALKFRPASEIIFARPIGEFDISGRTNKAGIVAMTVTAAKAVASATTAAIESAIRPQLDPTAA